MLTLYFFLAFLVDVVISFVYFVCSGLSVEEAMKRANYVAGESVQKKVLWSATAERGKFASVVSSSRAEVVYGRAHKSVSHSERTCLPPSLTTEATAVLRRVVFVEKYTLFKFKKNTIISATHAIT